MIKKDVPHPDGYRELISAEEPAKGLGVALPRLRETLRTDRDSAQGDKIK